MAELEYIAEDSDRRREMADHVELLMMRMDLLRPRDRVLVESYIRHGVSFRKLSWLSGKNERTVARRVNRLIRRLIGREYITIVRHKQVFTRQELDVAYDCFLLGLSYRSIAAKRKLTHAVTRRIIGEIRAWLKRKNDATAGSLKLA